MTLVVWLVSPALGAEDSPVLYLRRHRVNFDVRCPMLAKKPNLMLIIRGDCGNPIRASEKRPIN
jgi:hypothetical protein